jgi:hypothetical protein
MLQPLRDFAFLSEPTRNIEKRIPQLVGQVILREIPIW